MPIGFGAAKCTWMVPQTASKSSQYTITFVCFREYSVLSEHMFAVKLPLQVT